MHRAHSATGKEAASRAASLVSRSHRAAALLAACAIAVAAAPAAAQRVPESRGEIALSFAPLVKRAAPAVVNIYAKRVVRAQPTSPFMDDPFFRRFFGDSFSFGFPRERIQNSLGSGVIVAADGLVVTNFHVIDKSDEITVVLADRREFDVTLVGADQTTDLAVLRIKSSGERFPFLELRDSDELEVGDLVLAIGNPFGVGQTVTNGIVSALARTARGVSDFGFFIQTDAAINPGNSGGALFAMDGRLIGINTAIYTRSGGSNGIGFAAPSNMVRVVLDGALAGGKPRRPWMALAGQDVTADIASSLSLPRPLGLLVNDVFPGGPAARAGIRVGDVIVAVNGREVADGASFRFRIATLPLGSAADVAVVRAGAERRLAMALEAAPETPPRATAELDGRHPFAGATVANLSPALSEGIGLAGQYRGVVVLDVRRGSVAARVGFRGGDVIAQVNGADVASVTQLRRLVERPEARWQIAFRRDGAVRSVVIQG
ncbi:MAG: Do family serine endopeptidase [Alphaproteobacteria bacterium]|nr:Do family serine endopeptidase [Alphaproteobacteria bacterium]